MNKLKEAINGINLALTEKKKEFDASKASDILARDGYLPVDFLRECGDMSDVVLYPIPCNITHLASILSTHDGRVADNSLIATVSEELFNSEDRYDRVIANGDFFSIRSDLIQLAKKEMTVQGSHIASINDMFTDFSNISYRIYGVIINQMATMIELATNSSQLMQLVFGEMSPEEGIKQGIKVDDSDLMILGISQIPVSFLQSEMIVRLKAKPSIIEITKLIMKGITYELGSKRR